MVFRKILSFLDPKKAQKLQEYRRALEEAVSDGIITPEEEAYLSSLREELGLSYENVKQVALEIFREELDKAVIDEELSLEEQIRLHQLKEILNLRDEDIKEELEKIAELIILREAQNGKLPEIPHEGARKHLILMPDEICHCLVNAELYKRVIKRERGHYHGLSFRVARGVYYRIGSYTAPKIKEEIIKVDEGTLGITSKRLVFIGKQTDIEILLEKILNVEVFQDAFTIHRKGRKYPEYFAVDRPKLVAGILHAAAVKALERTIEKKTKSRQRRVP
jgi:hypothetical protein